MSKYPDWSKDDLETLQLGLDTHVSFDELSRLLDRSVIGLKLIAYRRLKYKPLCLDCGERIVSRNGNRLRCPECASKRNKTLREKNHQDNKAYYRNLKAEARFGGNRQTCFERDKYTCQTCGKTHHETMLDVHHKDKMGRNKPVQNNDIDNLITLCHSCHTKSHKEDTIMKRWAK